jgi:tetratricopeptide (TPR) repeat protein
MLRHPGLPAPGYERTANNDFVQALVETGTAGTLALLTIFVMWFVAVRVRSRECVPGSDAGARLALGAALGGITAIAAAALIESPMQRAETWALMWLYCALPLCSGPSRAEFSGWGRRVAGATAALAVTAFAGWYVSLPVRASYWTGRGVRLEFSNALPEAIAAYRRAIACDATNASAWFNLTRAYAKRGEYAAAWQVSEGATLRVHEDTLWLLRVRLLEAMNEPLRARTEVADGLRRFPWSGDLLAEAVALGLSSTQR